MEQNPFSNFNPFSFINGSSEAQMNPFTNPFQMGNTQSFQNPWMQNNNAFANMQDWQSNWMNQLFQGNQNQFFSNDAMMRSAAPWMNFSQQMSSKIQDWQKQMQVLISQQYQQNLLSMMIEASKKSSSDVSQQMGNIIADWKKYDLGQFLSSSALNDLSAAISIGDLEKQKKALEQICKQWIDCSKNLQRLNVISMPEKTWMMTGYKKMVDEVLNNFEKIQSRHFDNEDQQNLKNYLASLSKLFEGFSALVENFSDFESKLTDTFINAALSPDIELKDVTDLFNLWCAKFDECYNKQTLTNEYQEAYANWVNAISDFKIALQKITDKFVEQAGLPSNREMNTVHRRLHQVFKDNAKLKGEIAALKNNIVELRAELGKAKKNPPRVRKSNPRTSN